MLDLQGEPHIMDFGLAKRDNDEITMTIQGEILWTPAYMSPEQARGEPHGKIMLHQGSITAVAFSPDGKTVLTGSPDKTTIPTERLF